MQFTEQDRSSWLTELARVLGQGDDCRLNGIAVYILGSYATTPAGRDIDLLIVYDKGVVALPEALRVRDQLARRVARETGKQTHICLLSSEEPEWLAFAREEKARIVIDHRGRWGPEMGLVVCPADVVEWRDRYVVLSCAR